ncbi:MAG: SUMF1/EgtB/PvdO family nonheme iron enzyme, partial [Pseudomonadota bacterium]
MNFLKYTVFSIIILLFGFPYLLSADQNSENKEKASYYLKKASNYYNRKQYKKSESAFQQVLRTKISLHEDFYFFYGRVQALNGNYDKAEGNISMYLDSAGKKGQYYQQAKTIHLNVRKKLATKAFSQAQKESATGKYIPQDLSTVPNMIKIKTKAYLMGAKHGDEDQKPPHTVKLNKAIAVSQHEITFNQYEYFAKATKRKLPDASGWGRGNRPVINVSFYDAMAYCKWLSDKYNRVYRLPTEAEWEYFSRTTYQNKLGFKDLIGLGDSNCDGCRFFWEDDNTKTVGSYEPNSFNLYDTFGNVWEWTCSAYTRKYNGQEKICLSPDELEGKTIAVRGGSWKSSKLILKPYVRYNNFPGYKSNDLGFRIIEEL